MNIWPDPAPQSSFLEESRAGPDFVVADPARRQGRTRPDSLRPRTRAPPHRKALVEADSGRIPRAPPLADSGGWSPTQLVDPLAARVGSLARRTPRWPRSQSSSPPRRTAGARASTTSSPTWWPAATTSRPRRSAGTRSSCASPPRARSRRSPRSCRSSATAARRGGRGSWGESEGLLCGAKLGARVASDAVPTRRPGVRVPKCLSVLACRCRLLAPRARAALR